MNRTGVIILCRFPYADLQTGKLRPDIDELIRPNDADYVQSGLRNESVIRVERLAVVEETILLGEIGSVSDERLKRIKSRLSDWLRQ